MIFDWPPAWAPSFVLKFTFKFDWLTYTANNFQQAKCLTIWRLSGDGSDDIHKPMLGLIGLIIANQSSLQRKITTQERRLCWPPLFSLAPQCPQFFYSDHTLRSSPGKFICQKPVSWIEQRYERRSEDHKCYTWPSIALKALWGFVW